MKVVDLQNLKGNKMVKNKPRKVRGAKQLAQFFRKEGKVMTEDEYNSYSRWPIRPTSLKQLYKTYDIALQWVTMVDKTIEADLAPKPKAAPKPKPKVKANDTKDV